MLDPLPPDWRTYSACHPERRPDNITPAQWVGQFFPEDDDARSPAKEICRRCFVRQTCLESSLDDAEQIPMPRGTRMTGIAAGVGSSARVHLLSVRRRQRRPHRYRGDCRCRFCSDARALLAPGRVLNRNGPGARCGYVSTYSRGCRCTSCEVASALQYHRSKTIHEAV